MRPSAIKSRYNCRQRWMFRSRCSKYVGRLRSLKSGPFLDDQFDKVRVFGKKGKIRGDRHGDAFEAVLDAGDAATRSAR